MLPTLDGSSPRPLIMQQADLDNHIAAALEGAGFSRLSYAEFNEVVCSLSFPSNVTIFGPQVTVEYALFHDLLGLCADPG